MIAIAAASSRAATSRLASLSQRGFLSSSHAVSLRHFSAQPVEEDSYENSVSPETSTPKAEPPTVEPRKKVPDDLPVNFADISRAHVSIRSGIVRTTCEKSYFLSELTGANIFLKTEFRQFTGSFKERGARNAIMQLLREKGSEFRESGAIAASAGNHALALAYHGRELGVPVTVVMPTVAPLAKVEKCRVSRVCYLECSFWQC